MPAADLTAIGIDPQGDLEQQITAGFFKVLKKNIEEEQDPEKWQAFSERVYDSGFRDFLQRRVGQVAAKIQSGQGGPSGAAGLGRERAMTSRRPPGFRKDASAPPASGSRRFGRACSV